jgi:polyisoprenoid-binding protein YceI
MKKPLLSILALAAAGVACAAPYAFDPLHTHVMFEIDHIISTNRGRFDRKEGTVDFDSQARTGNVTLSLDMSSINTGVAPFNKALQSRDFFNVEEHPTARFASDGFVFDGSKLVEVNGKLTMLGKTHPVKLKALRFACVLNTMLNREVCGGDFEATISRSAWGINWGLPRFPDSVRLLLQVEAIKQ